jgi:TM2 domain-containing membrane protein YozV
MEDKIVVKKLPKSPGLAGVLAFFFPFGVGPLYNGQYRKALIYFFIFAGLVTLQTSGHNQPFLGLCLAGFIFYQIFDSAQIAKNINRRFLQQDEKVIEEIEEIPEMVKSGSIFWGAFIILLGGMLLLANFEILDYNTLWEFWPVIVIAIGIKLIADYFVSEKKKTEGGKNG